MIDNHHYITVTASPVVGTIVKTTNDKIIGEISGVVVDTKSGKAPYAVLALDNQFKIRNRQHILLSWKRLSCHASHQHAFILNVDNNKLSKLHDYFADAAQYTIGKPLAGSPMTARVSLAR